MKKLSDCQHEHFHADVKIARLSDSGKFMAEIVVSCTECSEPFRFVGIPAGLSFDGPRVSIDGLMLNAPIEPEIEKQLFATASYQMPEIVKRH